MKLFASRRPAPSLSPEVLAAAAAGAEQFMEAWCPVFRHCAEIEARRDAGESPEALAAELGVPVECVADLKGCAPRPIAAEAVA